MGDFATTQDYKKQRKEVRFIRNLILLAKVTQEAQTKKKTLTIFGVPLLKKRRNIFVDIVLRG